MDLIKRIEKRLMKKSTFKISILLSIIFLFDYYLFKKDIQSSLIFIGMVGAIYELYITKYNKYRKDFKEISNIIILLSKEIMNNINSINNNNIAIIDDIIYKNVLLKINFIDNPEIIKIIDLYYFFNSIKNNEKIDDIKINYYNTIAENIIKELAKIEVEQYKNYISFYKDIFINFKFENILFKLFKN